jgi:hypothetical protein
VTKTQRDKINRAIKTTRGGRGKGVMLMVGLWGYPKTSGRGTPDGGPWSAIEYVDESGKLRLLSMKTQADAIAVLAEIQGMVAARAHALTGKAT